MIEEPQNSSDEAHEQLARGAAFLRRVSRFWGVPLALLVVGVAACAAFLVLRKPAYRSETVILYTEGVRQAEDEDRPDNARSVTVRLKELLLSRTSLEAVRKEFDLYPDVRESRGPTDAVEELRKHVEFRAPGGDTFSIAFTGASPAEAQRVTTRLADIVIGQDSALRKKQAEVTRDFLETEKHATESGLRDAEMALASFMAAHPRFALDATPLATGAAIRATLAPQVGAPQAPAMRFRQPGAFAGGGGTAGAPGAAGPSAAPGSGGAAREAAAEEARATAALAAAQANLADLSAHFTAAHPDVRAAQAEVDRATARLSTATAALATARADVAAPSVARTDEPVAAAPPPPVPKSMPGPAQAAGPPVVTMVGAVPSGAAPPPSERSGDVVALETAWVKLTRAVTEARQHEDQVEAALFKASSAVSSESGGHGVQVTTIDAAFLPTNAVPPGRVVIASLFVSVSLLLGALVALGRAFLDDRVYGGRDVTRFAELLAEVPRASPSRPHVTS